MDRNVTAFLAVAETGNLTLAADKVALAQPSLSKRLAKLEESLGVQLFERHRRGMELTGAGRLFLQRATRISHEFDQVKEELRSLQDAGLSSLRVGAGPLFSLNFICFNFRFCFSFLSLCLSVIENIVKFTLCNLFFIHNSPLSPVYAAAISPENPGGGYKKGRLLLESP